MTIENASPTVVNIKDTNCGYTLSLINGKYKIIILYSFLEYKPIVRFNELQRYIDTISFKTLSVTLQEMEKDKLIIREEFPQIPPKVEYRLSERGKSLIAVLDMMCVWGHRNRL